MEAGFIGQRHPERGVDEETYPQRQLTRRNNASGYHLNKGEHALNI